MDLLKLFCGKPQIIGVWFVKKRPKWQLDACALYSKEVKEAIKRDKMIHPVRKRIRNLIVKKIRRKK